MLMVPKCQTPKVLERNSKTLKPLDERSVLTLLLASCESNSGLVSFLTGVGQSVEAKKDLLQTHIGIAALLFFHILPQQKKVAKISNS